MIWLAWRQHRKQLFVALIGLAVLALVLIPTGLSSHKAISAYSTCVDKLGTADFITISKVENCENLADKFGVTHETWAYAGILLLALPLLIGLFWGAPLIAREVEQGTHRLVWTQGITRRRWALTKFGLVAPTVVVLSAVYAVLVTWWMEPLNGAIGDRFDFLFFDQQGVVPIAYTLFAVALGVFAGSVVPRMLPAMATTLVAFLFARIVITAFVRPNILEPKTETAPVSTTESGRILPNPAAGNWQMDANTHAADGHVTQADGIMYCVPREGSGPGGSCGDTVAGAYNQWTYQPGDRYWMFQWVEFGIYALLSAALLYGALHRVRRSIA